MPTGRKTGSANIRTLEFIQKFEQLSEKYGDPVEAAFKLTKSRTQSIKIQAVNLLLKYRYPTLAAVHVDDGSQKGQIAMSWDEPSELEAPDLSDLQDPEILGQVVALPKPN